MSALVPCALGKLVSRMFGELARTRSIFDLQERHFVLSPGARDLSVRFHDQTAATPLGPAAGPHSQLAQNIALGFLGGARIFELKTVQILDRLKIPRPCIDMRGTGANVEWSQELTLEESLEEYVKASMLLEVLVASGELPFAPGFGQFIFDLSVGYDLAGIASERVQAFIRGLRDARSVIDRLRAQLPARFRDLAFRRSISNTVTLSTFHGCPPDEIGRIATLLLEQGLDVVVKLNPTLLGRDETRRIFNEVLGYPEHIPDDAFARDARWQEAVDFTGRLQQRARELGRGFGVKLTNTLVVENDGSFLPASEKHKYMSGQPLHVLAAQLVARFRETFGPSLPISFSGGIDRQNFADAVALGLCPVTVCTDLLRPRGYARLHGYFAELDKRMGPAQTIDQFIARERLDARQYAQRVLLDRRYAHAAVKAPPKRGTHLQLFDCLSCDKCIPVCPNDANFTFTLPRLELPIEWLRNGVREQTGVLRIEEDHQLANFGDACNECGNCDVFCPEDGGPYAVKPRFFGSVERLGLARDGFHVEGDVMHARFHGRSYRLSLAHGAATYSGDTFEVRLAGGEIVSAQARGDVELTWYHLMHAIMAATRERAGTTFLDG